MRATDRDNGFSALAIAGTRVVLIALDCDSAKLPGLMGFAFKRSIAGKPARDLMGIKVFKSLVPAPKRGDEFSTFDHPIQSFLWSDYTATPGTTYKFTIEARYGKPGKLETRATLELEVTTEKENAKGHGIWFNRGAIASQAFAEQFGNKSLTPDEINDIANKETEWLSRGLVEACLAFMDGTPAGEGLRVCAYEFTYEPVIKALKAALDRGVDVQIIYHDTKANRDAIAAVGIPDKKGRKIVLIKRTRPKIPHNKFIVRLTDGKPQRVWTGSTNFTPSGFLGQTNVGHEVSDAAVADTYLAYWKELSDNPVGKDAKANAMALTPNPANVVPPKPVTRVFSPRKSDRMLDWYAQRIADARASVMFTGAFGIDTKILKGLAQSTTAMRFILLEKPPTTEVRDAIAKNRGDIQLSFGAALGERQGKNEEGKPTKKLVPIPHFKLEEWFLHEDLERKTGEGFVFFIHTKFLLVDPLSNDPLVCTGSANFSHGSLVENDENMLLIRGDTRVADIYLTEFDRIFRHFYFRDIANKSKDDKRVPVAKFLEENDAWTKPYFQAGNVKNRRREMFASDPRKGWSAEAASDGDPFAGEAKGARRSSRVGRS
jgi:phosphatidylserine/phosphatidylglycerophosphate/cardiolipin synthase-like enzyme